MGKSKYLNTLSEMLYLHGKEKTRIFGILKQIFLVTRKELFKIPKTGTSLEKDKWDPCLYSSLRIFNTVIQIVEKIALIANRKCIQNFCGEHLLENYHLEDREEDRNIN